MNAKIPDFLAPCNECGGKCCEYVAIEIDKPTSKSDYDNVRWYLVHRNVNIFIDHDSKWFIEFRTPCEKQQFDKRCSIYEIRPKICRDHGNVEGECEFYDNPYKKYFKTAEEFQLYLENKGIDWRFKKYK